MQLLKLLRLKSANLGVIKSSPSAKIEGIITSLSLMKSCNFYDGQITNIHSSVGFVGSIQIFLVESYESSEADLLDSCEIKKARQVDSLEIIVKKGTEILKSQKSFKIIRDKPVLSLMEKAMSITMSHNSYKVLRYAVSHHPYTPGYSPNSPNFHPAKLSSYTVNENKRPSGKHSGRYNSPVSDKIAVLMPKRQHEQ